jgi:hypothetical protein
MFVAGKTLMDQPASIDYCRIQVSAWLKRVSSRSNTALEPTARGKLNHFRRVAPGQGASDARSAERLQFNEDFLRPGDTGNPLSIAETREQLGKHNAGFLGAAGNQLQLGEADGGLTLKEIDVQKPGQIDRAL